MQSCITIVFKILAVCIILSCSQNNSSVKENNGVNYFYNNKRLNLIETDTVRLNKITEIKAVNNLNLNSDFNYPADIDFDSKDNLYILDYKKSSIKKFNLNGEFICSFGSKGNGPGEFIQGKSVSLLNDTVFVSDPNHKKAILFSTDGLYLNTIHFDCLAPEDIVKLSEGFCGTITGNINSDNKLYYVKDLWYFNSKLKKANLITGLKIEINLSKFINPLATKIKFCTTDNLIYVSTRYEDYHIEVFDKYGNLKSVIKKPFIKVKASDEFIDKTEKKYRLKNENKLHRFKAGFKYLRTIENIYCDKYDRIWVKTATNDKSSALFDIFENNIYTKKIYFPYKYERLYFLNNKIVTFNDDKFEIYTY